MTIATASGSHRPAALARDNTGEGAGQTIPTPVSLIVAPVSVRCNLRCSYCYRNPIRSRHERATGNGPG
jgi:sulfatase maturation enzyme AslB (radical SAM superfamily)